MAAVMLISALMPGTMMLTYAVSEIMPLAAEGSIGGMSPGNNLASSATPDASKCTNWNRISGLNDGNYSREGTNDLSYITTNVNTNRAQTYGWGTYGLGLTNLWVTLTWSESVRINTIAVKWFFDREKGTSDYSGDGHVQLPDTATLEYLDGTVWRPVNIVSDFGFISGSFDYMRFNEVETTSLRLTMTQSSPARGVGIQEWQVYNATYTESEQPNAEPGERWNESMHFIVRHWHAVADINTQFQGEEASKDDASGRYFVVGEGYIIPVYNTAGSSITSYNIYMVTTTKMGDTEYKVYTLINNKNTADNDYFGSVDTKTGTVNMNANPVYDNGTPMEHFSGFSVTAGHAAVLSDKVDGVSTIRIKYDPDIHLVKAHIFYIDDSKVGVGSASSLIFDDTSATEKDTAYAYTYIKDVGGKEIGDLVLDSNGQPVFDADKLPAEVGGVAIEEGVNVQKTKIYNTTEGLHTDKTASVSPDYTDGRTFDLDLEAWYSGELPANVGLVLDSSGSMAFASEDLKPMKVTGKLPSDFGTYYSSNYLSNTITWNDIFLSDTQVSKILDSRNTDNSRLGETGYNYYVYDARPSVLEYVPMAYWGGANEKVIGKPLDYDAVKNDIDDIYGYYSFTSNDNKAGQLKDSKSGGHAHTVLQGSTPGWSDWKQGSDTDIVAVSNRITISDGRLELTSSRNYAVLLKDRMDRTFSVSFTLSAENCSFGSTANNRFVDIMYIEDSSYRTTTWPERYFRLLAGDDGYLYYAKHDSDTPSRLSSTKLLTGNGDSHIITVTFDDHMTNNTEDTAVYVYCDGVNQGGMTMTPRLRNDQAGTNSDGGKSNYIVFNAFAKTGFSGNLYVDDIYVFDKVLTSNQAKQMGGGENNVALTDDLKHRIGTADSRFNNQAGWYYVNHTSSWNTAYYCDGVETGKVLSGIRTGIKFPKQNENDTEVSKYFTDTMITPSTFTAAEKATALQGNSDEKFTPGADTPTKFFIDSAGYLRCFFYTNSTDDAWNVSYVYESSDMDYVKAEALQRAIGSFAAKLNEKSPNSMVAATRFSTPEAKGYLDKLVMLDWTNDPGEIQGMLSLERGVKNSSNEGGTRSGDDSTRAGKALTQYNYGLTGQTSTFTGLQAFNDILVPRSAAVAEGKKYLIIFTDGLDTDRNDPDYKDKAASIASDLKKDGYTILTIMLTGGPMVPGGTEYEDAKKFLIGLSGNTAHDKDDKYKEEHFFFSTDEHGDGDSASSKVDVLTNIFTGKVIDFISENLEGYEIKDYIDPRFDIVDRQGRVWHLDSKGKVTVVDINGNTVDTFTLSGTNFRQVLLTSDTEVEASARRADLYYDAQANMYYLKWGTWELNGRVFTQIIPNCNSKTRLTPDGTEESDRVEVWHGRVTVRAKEDFIGGNDVLTNGNLMLENFVYSPDDNNNTNTNTKSTSGITDTVIEDENAYVSKGFPRTTVNVGMDPGMEGLEQMIYLGEPLTPAELAEALIKHNIDDVGEVYYWLQRYSIAKNISLTALIQQMFECDVLEIEYSYIMNAAKNNQTGVLHEDDMMGVLRYKWEPVDPDTGDVITDENGYGTGLGPKKYNKFTTQDTRDVKYKLTVSYWPYPDPDDALWKNENLLTSENTKLGRLENELNTLQNQLNRLDPNSSDYEEKAADLKAQIADKKAEIIDQRNYIDYIKWCLGLNSTGSQNKIDRRKTENSELITEVDYGPSTANGHKAYYPKTAVGDAQYDAEVSGTHTTYIVRGELSFEMTLDYEALSWLFGDSWKSKAEDGVTYTVNVKREYNDTLVWTPDIPDLTITITEKDLIDLKNAEEAEDDSKTIYYVNEENNTKYPKAVLLESGKVTFYSDPRVFDPAYEGIDEENYSRLLPIGTYTLTPDAKKNEADWSDFEFSDIEYSPREHYTRDQNHFTDDENALTAKDSVYKPGVWNDENSPYYDPDHPQDDPNYFAYQSGTDGTVSFELGTHALAETETRSYLEDRVGMAMISGTLNLKVELPATIGEQSPNTVYYIVGCVFLVNIAALLYLYISKFTGRKKNN